MSRQVRQLVILLAFAVLAWGVFLIEDGLFNSGSVDAKEFSIGCAFFAAGLLFAFVSFRIQPGIIRLSPTLYAGALLLALVYTASVYSRWHSRGEIRLPVAAAALIVGHIKATHEWIMVPESLLQRPAHWYESSVQLTYLADNGKQALSIELPAKFLPLKPLKTFQATQRFGSRSQLRHY